MYLLWEAMLISYLAAERTVILPFEGIESLVTKSNYKIAVNPNTAQMDSFKYSKISTWQTAWYERIEPNLDFYAEYPFMKQFEMISEHPSIAAYNNHYVGV